VTLTIIVSPSLLLFELREACAVSYLRAGRYFKDGWYRRFSCSNHLEQPKIKNSVEVTPRRIIMKKQSRIPALLDIFLQVESLGVDSRSQGCAMGLSGMEYLRWMK